MLRAARKRRTREHVIADLGLNHVERFVLRCGHTMERFRHDYGFDLLLFTYDNNGEYENGDVRLQVKASDKLPPPKGGAVAWRVDCAHLRHWLNEPMPVILIVYDAQRDMAYWLYIQQYFEARRVVQVAAGRGTLTVKLPKDNVLDEKTVRRFSRFRDIIVAQSRGVIRHHD
jgi:hypothetical protein